MNQEQTPETLDEDTRPRDPAPPARARGLVVGDYLVGRHLASGGMGEVFEATHTSSGRVVALKLSANDARARTRAIREARLAAELDDDGVVRVLDAGMHGDSYFIAMERLAGRDLAALVRARGPLPIRGACQILGHVARTCARMHARNIIHRDLKPSNVFLCDGGAVKLIDFGLAKDMRDPGCITGSGATVGTAAFMAPEQVTDSKRAGPEADCYALGGLLLFSLTGRVPHDAELFIEQLTQAVTGRVPRASTLRPEVPGWLSELAARSLDRRPPRRPSAAEFAAELEERS